MSLTFQSAFVTLLVTLFTFCLPFQRQVLASSASANDSDSAVASTPEPGSHELRLWEVRTAPVAMLVNWYTLDVAYRTSENFSTGPSAVFYNAPEDAAGHLPAYRGSAWGWHANYYFDSVMRNTWYFGARAYYESFRAYHHSRAYEDVKGIRGAAFLGYQWKWSRINLITGIGMEYRGWGAKDYKDPSVDGTFTESRESELLPMIEVKVGIEI